MELLMLVYSYTDTETIQAIMMEVPGMWVAFNTGTVKPVVLLKRVLRVRVRSRFLAYRDTPRTRTTVSRVFTGLLQQCETRFSCFKSCFP